MPKSKPIRNDPRLRGYKGDPEYRKYLRLAIIMRDGTACWLCGRDDLIEPDEGTNWGYYDPRMMTFDHLVPKSMGGWDDYNNLKIACAKCNSRRGDRIHMLPKRLRRKAERSAKRWYRKNAKKGHEGVDSVIVTVVK